MLVYIIYVQPHQETVVVDSCMLVGVSYCLHILGLLMYNPTVVVNSCILVGLLIILLVYCFCITHQETGDQMVEPPRILMKNKVTKWGVVDQNSSSYSYINPCALPYLCAIPDTNLYLSVFFLLVKGLSHSHTQSVID